ncbi:hypothetical protein RvVAR031_01090 [Agrobacterium vitis]|nr:hypothetical protein RvVAR031_01090 [Agrobacterium vitis]
MYSSKAGMKWMTIRTLSAVSGERNGQPLARLYKLRAGLNKKHKWSVPRGFCLWWVPGEQNCEA